jgi:hypothetical protein
MLHDANDVYFFTVTDSVGFSLDGTIQKVIKENFVFRKMFPDIKNVRFEFLLVDHNLHALAAQDIGRAYEQREPDCLGYLNGFICIGSNTKFR